MLSSNFNNKLKKFIASDQAFTFMNFIKGASAYWKIFLFEVLAMVKQLLFQTFFVTFLSADLKWNELISIMNNRYKQNLSEEGIGNLNYHERCRLLSSNSI